MNMEVYTSNVENNELILEGNFKTISISFSDEETVRIRHFNKDEKEQFSYLKKDIEVEVVFGVIRRNRNEITMISKKLCVEINLDPFNIKVFRINGGLIFSGEELDFVDIDNNKSNIKFNLDLDTILFGVFKDERGKFKYFPKVRYLIPKNKWKKGLYELVNSNYLFTSNEFGIFVNTYKPIRYKFNWQLNEAEVIDEYLIDDKNNVQIAKERSSSQSVSEISIEDDCFDIFLIFKKSNEDFMKEYNNLIGKPPLLPKWSYGYIHSKGNTFGISEIKSTIEEFRNKNIPIDSMELNLLSSDENENKWLKDDFFLKENRVSLLISLYPFLKYIEKQKSNEVIWNEIKKLGDKNVKGYKIDLEGNTEKEKMNLMLLVKYIWEKLDRNKRNLFVLENINPGLSKYGTIINKSKAVISYENLKNNVKYLIATNMSEPYLSNSINFENNDNNYCDTNNVEPELFIRWLQCSVFFPIFIFSNSMFFSEPWAFGKSVEKIVTEFIRLRYSLVPYIYSNMRRTFDTSKPFIEQVSRDIEDEYYFGANILVAPIMEKDAISRKVFIPEGIWWDYWTRSIYEGPKDMDIEIQLERIPLFIKAGSIIPTSTGIQNANEKINSINLHVFPGQSGNFTIYDDDGETNDYLENAYMTIDVSYNEDKDKKTILINPVIGNYFGMSNTKNINIFIHNIFEIEDLKIDGESSNSYKYYDDGDFVLINIEDYNLKSGCTISYYDKSKIKVHAVKDTTCSINFFTKRNGISILDILALNYPVGTPYKIDLKFPEGYYLDTKNQPLSSKITKDLNLSFEVINSKLGEKAKDDFEICMQIGEDIFTEKFELVCDAITKWSIVDCIYGNKKDVEEICEVIETSSDEIYILSGDEKKLWLKVENKDSFFGIIEFPILKSHNHAVSYAKTRVYSPCDQEIYFEISCNTNISMFLNHVRQFEIEEVLFKNIYDKPIKLVKGWNDILIKLKTNVEHKKDDFLGFRLTILDNKKSAINDVYYDY